MEKFLQIKYVIVALLALNVLLLFFLLLVLKKAKLFLEKVKWLVSELVLTLSNKPSFFSIKRLGRAFLFNTALISIICYLWNRRATIETSDIVLVFSVLMGYAGFSSVMSRQDKIDQAKFNTEQTNQPQNNNQKDDDAK